MRALISIIPNQSKSAAGLKLWTAFKPAANGRYLMCNSLPHYVTYCTEIRISDNFKIVNMQVNGPLSKRGGANREYPEEKQPDSQSKHRHHILEVKMHHPYQGSNPSPLTLVISSLGQNAPTLTH